MKAIPEDPVKAAFVTMMNKLTYGRSRILLPFAAMLKAGKNTDVLDRLNELEVLLEKNTERRKQVNQFYTKGLLDPAVHTEESEALGKETYSSRYALSSIVLCGHCGDIFRRVVWQNRGNKIIVWRCVSRVLKKQSGVDCPARTLREEELQAAVVTAINDAYYQQNGIIPLLQNNVQKILKKDMEERLTLVEAALKEKQAELLKAEKDQVNEIGEAIINLREERQGILTEIAKNTELKERVDDISAFLGEQIEALTEYSEAMVRRLIEKVTVYDEKLTVEFKSGLTIDVDA